MRKKQFGRGFCDFVLCLLEIIFPIQVPALIAVNTAFFKVCSVTYCEDVSSGNAFSAAVVRIPKHLVIHTGASWSLSAR